MKRTILVIGVFILGLFVYDGINTNLNDKKAVVYSDNSELEQHDEDDLKKYSGIYDFPMNEINYPDPEAFTLLKNSYRNIDFYGNFEPGDLELYDDFKLGFLRLLNNEVPFIKKSTGEPIYIKDFENLNGDSPFNPCDYYYLFFDMDEDGTPELCINDSYMDTYIYKYNHVNNEFLLIDERYPSHYGLNGSNKIRWHEVDNTWEFYVFYKYDELSVEEYSTHLFSNRNYNEKMEKSETVYMAGLPHYTNKSKQTAIPDKIKEQAYIDEGSDLYYFRVTEEQFDDLTKDYWMAVRTARRSSKNVTYTYDELFNENDKDYTVFIESFIENGSYVDYPQIKGLEDKKKQTDINTLLKEEVYIGSKDYLGETFVDFSDPDYVYEFDTNAGFTNQDIASFHYSFFAYGDVDGYLQQNSRHYGVTIDMRTGKKIELSDFMIVDERLIYSTDGSGLEIDYNSLARPPFHKVKDVFSVYTTEEEKDVFHRYTPEEMIEILKDPMRETNWYIDESKQIIFLWGENYMEIPYEELAELIYPQYLESLRKE